MSRTKELREIKRLRRSVRRRRQFAQWLRELAAGKEGGAAARELLEHEADKQVALAREEEAAAQGLDAPAPPQRLPVGDPRPVLGSPGFASTAERIAALGAVLGVQPPLTRGVSYGEPASPAGLHLSAIELRLRLPVGRESGLRLGERLRLAEERAADHG